MSRAGVISPADANAPTYEATINGLELVLPLMSTTVEIEHWCSRFLQALANVCGNCKTAAEVLKKKWSDEVKKELYIDFNLLDLIWGLSRVTCPHQLFVLKSFKAPYRHPDDTRLQYNYCSNYHNTSLIITITVVKGIFRLVRWMGAASQFKKYT
jgi:hypothetical protein